MRMKQNGKWNNLKNDNDWNIMENETLIEKLLEHNGKWTNKFFNFFLFKFTN